jgi:hypothetical protein
MMSKAFALSSAMSTACWPLVAVLTCADSIARMREAMSRLISQSSTSSTRRPASRCDPAMSSSISCWAGSVSTKGWQGSSTRNRVPWPGSLSALIVPPISVTRSRVIARPSPEPPNWRVVELSAWVKRSNRRSIMSRSMPMPVSLTVMAKRWA